jgi:hypothetical protein
MPVPIKKLSDRFEDYVLKVRCRKCGHERTTEPHVLARLLGWETPLNVVATFEMQCELTASSHFASCKWVAYAT